MSEERITELEAAIEVLSAKNNQLLGEVKTFKAKAKGVDIDPTEYAALQNENDALKSELTKTTKDSAKTIEALQSRTNLFEASTQPGIGSPKLRRITSTKSNGSAILTT